MFDFILSFLIVYIIVRFVRVKLVIRYIRALHDEIMSVTLEEMNEGIFDRWAERLKRYFEIVTDNRLHKAVNQFYLPIHSFFYKDYILHGDEDAPWN